MNVLKSDPATDPVINSKILHIFASTHSRWCSNATQILHYSTVSLPVCGMINTIKTLPGNYIGLGVENAEQYTALYLNRQYNNFKVQISLADD